MINSLLAFNCVINLFTWPVEFPEHGIDPGPLASSRGAGHQQVGEVAGTDLKEIKTLVNDNFQSSANSQSDQLGEMVRLVLVEVQLGQLLGAVLIHPQRHDGTLDHLRR